MNNLSTMPPKDLSNHEAELAWRLVSTTGTSLFLTGRAGTGKTTFLHRLRHELPKRLAVAAPTGIAAINAEGVTLHSLFQLPFAPFIPDANYKLQEQQHRFSKQKIKLIQSLDVLIIDEISMVRADLLDAVDAVLRRLRRSTLPFGGVQLVMIGDLGQLAPVAKEEEWALLSRYYDTPYFFSSNALRRIDYMVVEMKTVYRQSDRRFLELLNRVRDNRADAQTLAALNSRYVPGFQPKEDEGYIRLVTHNMQAKRINDSQLDALPSPPFSYKAEIDGRFPELLYPTDETLVLKLGAQVMFVKNDSSPEKRYYNGMIGRITAIGKRGFTVVANDTGDEIEVSQEQWDNTHYVLDEKLGEIKEEVEGTFRQFPVKTAWAITIHKSQGLTFDHALIDAHASFAHGQTYVALSRCRTLEGLVLSSPLPSDAIIRDQAVDGFTASALSRVPTVERIEAMQRSYYLSLVSELFDFTTLAARLSTLTRIVAEHFSKAYPKTALELKARTSAMRTEVLDVAGTFRGQYSGIIQTSADYATQPFLAERLKKGAHYFYKKVYEILSFQKRLSLETDNKEVGRRYTEALQQVAEELMLKSATLQQVEKEGFTPSAYLRTKSAALMEEPDKKKSQAKPKRTAQTAAEPENTDIQHPEVVRALSAWRKQKADELGKPAFIVMSQKTLLSMANLLPTTLEELIMVKGFGKVKADVYGREILEAIRTSRKG